MTRVAEKLRNRQLSTSDPACSVCACDGQLMVGRESGIVNVYSLPHVALERTVLLRCRPQVRGRPLTSPLPLDAPTPLRFVNPGLSTRVERTQAYQHGLPKRWRDAFKAALPAHPHHFLVINKSRAVHARAV